MANTTLDQLTALTGANAATGDKFLIDDVSESTAPTERTITLAELMLFLSDNMVSNVTTVTATDASFSTENNSIVVLNNDSTDIDLTFAAVIPTGATVVFHALDNGATSHTVTLGGSQTFDGTNNIATFDAAEETLTIKVISSTRVIVISNPSSVAFST